MSLASGYAAYHPARIAKIPRFRGQCARRSLGKENDGSNLKPFEVTPRVRAPPGKGGGRQPRASLAWSTREGGCEA